MSLDISITGMASISALGFNSGIDDSGVWSKYLLDESFISLRDFGELGVLPVGSIPSRLLEEVCSLRRGILKDVDPCVLLAVFCARAAVKDANWDGYGMVGVNFGSSRGATTIFEDYHKNFVFGKRVSAFTSPLSTLGNVSSFVASDLGVGDLEISHSVTCSTGLHALLNGIAWIESGMVDRVVVGAAESCLTPFTLAQMKALGIYSKGMDDGYYCRSLDRSKRSSTFVLGEGAAAFCLERRPRTKVRARITAVGFATEIPNSPTDIKGESLEKSMRMTKTNGIDVLVLHAPGTLRGDLVELEMARRVFGDPIVTGNKWKIGHSLGASGCLSLELAVLMLENQKIVGIPYLEKVENRKPKKVLVNAVGFGGNAVSILVEKG